MGLPHVPLPTDVVEVGGVEIKVRGLTRAEAAKVQKLGGDLAEVEIFMIAAATDTSEDDVRAWLAEVPAGAVDVLTTTIVDLSGLGEGAQKSK